MAPRAYWKGYLKLSLVSCPIALFPATSEREKISFHQLNKETGNRIRYKKVDADTGDEVDNADIVKGYELAKGEYIELDPEEIEAVAIDQQARHRHRRIRAAQRDRRALRPRSLLHRAGRRSRPAGLRRDPRGDPQGRHGGARQGGVHLARAHHRARSARQGHGRADAALPLRGAQGRRIFRRHRRREDPEGHARSRDPYRRDQDRALQAGGVQGPVRGRAQGSATQEAERRKDRAAEGARAVERHQSDGCAAAKRQSRRRQRGGARRRARRGAQRKPTAKEARTARRRRDQARAQSARHKKAS